jgi:phenylpropionate dioxygenase-like ring-hydroxylating dioxygenase large terminal subunit
MSGENSFLLNAWYMVGWSNEIDHGLLRRRFLGDPVLLFRKLDGSIAAMIDRCPHRYAPLSTGERDGDHIICPYHGLAFDSDGACVRNPFSDKLPKGANVRSFPVIERDGIAWFWPGVPEGADAALIPDFSQLIVPEYGAPLTGYMHMDAPYEMGLDNLLDLSHIEFVHKGSFAGNGVIFAGEHELVIESDRRLHSNWWMADVAAPPHTMGVYDPGTRCNHWLNMRWDAPANMALAVGACRLGEDRDVGTVAYQAHILTPESTTSTHYFWASARGHPSSEEGDSMLRNLFEMAFAQEDKPMIQATWQNMDGRDFWDLQPAYLGIDAGGTTARRSLQKLVAQEHG